MATISEDWQLHKSLKERHAYMLHHAIESDVTFSVRNMAIEDSNQERIRAHKYMLISASPVFRTMLCGDFPQQEVISVEDIDPNAFKEMLRFIYTEEINITGNTVMQILYASKKYNVPNIAKKCSEYLERQLCPANVCMILEQSEFFQEKTLSEKCLDIIWTETDESLRGDSFFQMSLPTLDKILDSESIAISELELFQRCLKWAHAQLKQQKQPIHGSAIRQALGMAIYKIRIPTIPVDEFSSIVSKSGVLTMEEEVQIFRYLALTNKPENPQLAFPTKQRFYRGKLYFLIPDHMDQPCFTNKFTTDRSLITQIQICPVDSEKLRSLCIITPYNSNITLHLNSQQNVFARNVMRDINRQNVCSNGASTMQVDPTQYESGTFSINSVSYEYSNIDVSHMDWVLQPYENNQMEIRIHPYNKLDYHNNSSNILYTSGSDYILTNGSETINIKTTDNPFLAGRNERVVCRAQHFRGQNVYKVLLVGMSLE